MEPISTELREMLGAYLDGELDADDARHVEQLMAREPGVEHELRRLERTWSLLDRLPQAEVDPSFTQSTVEMVALAVEDELRPKHGQRTRRGAVWGVAILVACLLGFIGARLVPDANRQVLRDLPIVDALEAYRQTPQIEFLRDLAKADVFDDETSITPADETIDERKKRLDSLSPEQKDDLHRKYERFSHLPADEQQRLRKLELAVSASDEQGLLAATLGRYQHWLEQLPGVERAELMALESEQRLVRIKRMRHEEARRLGAEDLKVFVAWFETIFPNLLPPAEREKVQRQLAQALEEDRPAVIRRAISAARQNSAGRRPVGRGPLIEPQALARLSEGLSPQANKVLSAAGSASERRALIWSWANQAFAHLPGGRRNQLALPEVDEDELRHFFQHELTADQRAQLLNLPADQMRRQLLLRYQAQHAAR